MRHFSLSLHCILSLLLTTLASVAGAQATRSATLYLQADANSHAVDSVVLNQELRQQSRPHSDPLKAGERWYQTERLVTLNGYVNNHDLLKDLSIREGAPLLQSPSQQSTALVQWVKTDKPEFGDVQGQFTQVTLRKTLPVYFQVPAAPVAVPVAPTNTIAPSNTPKPDGQPITPSITTHRFLSELPKDPQRIHYFVGTFRPYNSLVRVQIRYRFEIIGSDNRRIAFVNTDKISGAESLDRLFNKKVLITGKVQEIGDTGNFLIEATHIRPRDN